MSLDLEVLIFLLTTMTATSITTNIVAPAAQANPVTVDMLTPAVSARKDIWLLIYSYMQ